MNLVIFDVDGTLCDTFNIDVDCFLESVANLYGITEPNTDWAKYPTVTDLAITICILEERLNRQPDEDEIQDFKNHSLALLEDYRTKEPWRFKEIEGASQILPKLNQESEWKVAIASGCFRDSGTLKLKAAGIDVEDFPAAFAEDAFMREEILQSVVLKALKLYQQNHFERIVSVGDGLWDVRTARNLMLPFLGRNSGEGKEKLIGAGATHVIKDFTDYNELIFCLMEADIPKPEGTI